MAADSAAVGWQTGPSRRGTLTIIENCLFTIIACTWSIQHLNVPKLDEAWWRTLLRQCKWAVFTLFFPEFIMAHAILELVMVVGNIRSLNKEGRLDRDLPWAFRCFSRYFTRSKDAETGDAKSMPVPRDGEQQEAKWTLTHCYFANMGGFYMRDDTGSSSVKDHLLTTSHFIKYWHCIKIPNLSDDDLKDKSKTDYFAKTIAVIQIAQLLLSLIARRVQHLASSQLEILTLAFAICGVLTYGCFWYKPQNVKRPIQVFLRQPEEGLPPKIHHRTFDSLWQVLSSSKVTNETQPLERVPNDNIPRTKRYETHYALYVLTFLTGGFGSIHAIAWNFEFPTFIEQILWRVATLISTLVPPLALLAIPLAQVLAPWGDINNFRSACLDVMREYSWHTRDNEQVKEAMKTVRELCDNVRGGQHKHYRDILGEGDDSDLLGVKILEYIRQDEEVQRHLPKEFVLKFTQLVEILGGSSGSKRLWEAARTNTYPKRSLLSPSVNNGIIYITGIAYCLARLTILGIAFSSLRRMPESVYITPWTTNIPSVQ